MTDNQLHRLVECVDELKHQRVPLEEIGRHLVLLAAQLHINEHFGCASAEAQRAAAGFIARIACDIEAAAELRLPASAIN